MEIARLKKEDALYYCDKLLDAEGTELLKGIAINEDDIIRNKNFRYSILLPASSTCSFSIILENKDELRAFVYQEVECFKLSKDEFSFFCDKIKKLDKKEEAVLAEGFMAEIKEMKEVDAKCH